MPTVPAAAPRPQGGLGGDGRHRQRVRYPMRIITGPYADADVAVYGKVAALAQRGRSTASVEKIASFLGLSKSATEKAFTRLARPYGDDEVAEVLVRRRTHEISGTGQTAERWVRRVDEKAEAWVWAPMLAADVLRPRLHRLYLALRYAQRTRHQATLAELGELLRHRTGARAGAPLHETTVARLLAELEAAGWISVDRRAGHRGRHLITTHDHPLHPATAATPTPRTEYGSGPDLEYGSPAYKEDLELTDLENARAGGPSRRRRDTGSRAVDNPGRDATSPVYTGPELQLSPRVWAVLEPVRHLLPGISPYLLRRAAQEIGSQLDTYADIERLCARVRARHNTAEGGEIRDPGAWLLGAALPRHGCGLHECEGGVLWTTGRRCGVCEHLRADRRQTDRRRTGHPPHPPRPRPAAQRPATHRHLTEETRCLVLTASTAAPSAATGSAGPPPPGG
ncbi:hypothetical protein ACFCXP_11305 [Streptomyces niveus]|uniref:hypothetical protein n=1 Tax=Streptomyces niveus TaxID=193462 RepID=UPI0035D63E7E